MANNIFESVFKKGSRTYFYSSIFFPKEIKDDVFVLYAFVRTADDLVDSVPQKKEEFLSFKKETLYMLQNNIEKKQSENLIIDSFIKLANKHSFEKKWIHSFLASMEMDLKKTTYKDISELEKYIFGSAEVVGLMMARILGLKRSLEKNARLLGRAMQYINFIRDIQEDLAMGRTYFPQMELKKFGLTTLDFAEVCEKETEFKKFMLFQIERYFIWQKHAAESFPQIPRRMRIPIKTASDMYEWSAIQIKNNPLIVYKKKVKPSISRILTQIIKNSLSR